MYEKIIEDVLAYLESEVPNKYQNYVQDYKNLIGEKKYRASFYPLHKLCHLGDWHPSPTLRKLIEDYKVVF